MIFEAISALYPKAVYVKEREGVYTAQDIDYNTITLDMSAVNTKAAELEAVNDYQEPRKRAYPSVFDQLDQLYHDMTAGKLDATGDWHKSIKAVKDAIPKP